MENVATECLGKVDFNLTYFKLSSLLQDLHCLVEFILFYTCFKQDRLLPVEGWKCTHRFRVVGDSHDHCRRKLSRNGFTICSGTLRLYS